MDRPTRTDESRRGLIRDLLGSDVFRNASWLTVGNVLSKPLWLAFITIACIRVLGDSGYGILTATLFLTAIADSFADLGLTHYSIREVARRRDEASAFFSNLFVAKSALGLTAALVGVLAGIALGYEGAKLYALFFAAVYTMALGLTEYCRAYYRAVEIMRYEAVSVVSEKALVIGCALPALLIYQTAEATLAGMALGMMLVLTGNVAWIGRSIARIDIRSATLKYVMRVVPVAIPLGLASQFVVIYFRADAVMVDAMVGEEAAGQYGAAYRLVEAFMLIAAIVNTAVYPRLSTLFHEKKSAGFNRVLKTGLGAVVAVGLTVATGLSLFATPLLLLIKGDASFAPAADALRILAWAAPFMTANGLMAITLSASNDQRVLAVILGIGAVFNVAANFAVIPFYSFYGACVTTVATEVLVALLFAARYFTHTRHVLAA